MPSENFSIVFEANTVSELQTKIDVTVLLSYHTLLWLRYMDYLLMPHKILGLIAHTMSMVVNGY